MSSILIEEAEAPIKGITIATGVAIGSETYSISLKLGNLRNVNGGVDIKLQRRRSSDWVDVNEDDDLFNTNSELRIIVEDNTSLSYVNGRFPSRNELYDLDRGKSARLNSILNFSIPLKLEVRRFNGDQQLSIGGDNGIQAKIEVLDPEEDINHIKSESSKKFIGEFNSRIRKSSQYDNCPENLAPNVLIGKYGGDGGMMRILFYHNGKPLPSPTGSSGRQHNVAIVDKWQEGIDSNGEKYIYSNIVFRPPFILGDNYAFRVSLEKGPNIKYKNGKNGYETPKITIWRKVKVLLLIQGDRNLYNQVDWSIVQKLYSDAYIELDYPKDSSSDRVHVIPIDKWIKYLYGWIYCWWRKNEWDEVTKTQRNRVQQDLGKYSFPQKFRLRSGRWVDLAPEDDKRPTSWDLLKNLAKAIVKRYCLSHRQAENCFYAVLFRPPRDDSHVGGRCVLRVFNRGVIYIVVREGKPTGNAKVFAHELGHGLFLKHGAVKFIDKSHEVRGGSEVTEKIIVEAGAAGPYWELHDSENMASCIMSYSVHILRGNEYKPLTIDRCFCGFCLLLLRFYDEEKLRKNHVLREIQYMLRNGGTIRIAYTFLDPTPVLEKDVNLYILKNQINESQTLNMYVGDEYVVFALYPMEEAISYEGVKVRFFKDMSTSCFRLDESVASGKWGQSANIHGVWKIVDLNATDPDTAMEVADENKVVSISSYELDDGIKVAKIKAVREGSSKVYFGIKKVDNQYIWGTPLTVNVNKSEMVFTEEEVSEQR